MAPSAKLSPRLPRKMGNLVINDQFNLNSLHRQKPKFSSFDGRFKNQDTKFEKSSTLNGLNTHQPNGNSENKNKKYKTKNLKVKTKLVLHKPEKSKYQLKMANLKRLLKNQSPKN